MKLQLNSARKGNSDYSFSPMSLVTLDFGRLQPIMSFGVIPGTNISKFKGKGLLRCTPQVFPPFGRMNVKSAAFFVPDSQIFSWSSSFHADNKQWRGQDSSKVPLINSYSINTFFSNVFGSNVLSTVVASNPTTPPSRNTFDFTYPYYGTRTSGSTNLDFRKLTPYGWKLLSIFKSLGYDFISFCTDTSASLSFAQHLNSCSTFISLVPFLAYCKIWNDYFCNSYQSDNTDLADILQKIYLNKDVVYGGNTIYNSSTFIASTDLLDRLLSFVQVPYETNFYTTAWNNPNDPTGVEISRINQVNSQSLISPYGSNSDGEFASLGANSFRNTHSSFSSSSTSFSQLGHRTLEAFDRFVRRRNLVGSKSVQQLYALFGIQLDEWNKDYVVKLCETSSRVNFSAITSQSDTVNGAVGKPLGAFAGVGLSGYELDFSYKSSTFGTIICLSWLNIDPILMRGLSPDVLRISPLDFYNPDYDGKAYRPIPYAEVTGGKFINNNNCTPNQTYGYTNMYDDYRNMRDVVAGNFLDDTTKNFAFMRDLTDVRDTLVQSSLDMYPQSEDVQYWFLDGSSDLTNPFITAASLGDRFWFCVDWDIKCTQPILSPSNSLDLDGEGSLSFKKNGDGLA